MPHGMCMKQNTGWAIGRGPAAPKWVMLMREDIKNVGALSLGPNHQQMDPRVWNKHRSRLHECNGHILCLNSLFTSCHRALMLTFFLSHPRYP